MSHLEAKRAPPHPTYAKQMRELQKMTQTLGAENPVVSLLVGHHDLETFNKAFEAEGWSTGGFSDEGVTHEYWRKDKTGWVCSNIHDARALPVTIGEW
jgi:hypothetical protein